MKKLALGVVIFAIISVLVTGTLISVKNNKTDNTNNSNIVSGDKTDNPNISNISSNEKTLDLHGVYDENDLEIEEVIENVDGLNAGILIPKIKGLKNKDVENKINDDMKQQIIEELKDIPNIEEVKIDNQHFEVVGNFSNVLSIRWYNYKDGKYYYITLNYELVNGNRLRFEDLFTKDADLYSIVRKMTYKPLARSEVTCVGEEFFFDVHYDFEKNAWIGTVGEFNEETGMYEQAEKEYVPSLTDYDISKMINGFMKKQEKKFFFGPSEIYIVYGDNAYDFYSCFKDIANEVVIYDKYLTKDSLYENSNIGRKNLWTCATPNDRFIQYQNYGFLEDNLYYEVVSPNNSYIYESSNYPFKKSFKKLHTQAIEIAKNKIEEYRKIANQNKDKFYVLLIKSNANCSETGETVLISTNISESLAHADLKFKDEIMEKILECYRYYNIAFYGGSGLELALIRSEYFSGVANAELLSDLEEKEEVKTYDARNLKELTSISEIFKNDVDYMHALKDELKEEIRWRKQNNISEEELDKLVEDSEYTFDAYSIKAKVPGFDYDLEISYRDFDKSVLKIYDLEDYSFSEYIVPESNTRNIDKSEIQNLSLDELNKAYNEIFARHGHDFKNAELKEYFSNLSWYDVIPNKAVGLNELNEFEKYNLEIIRAVIAEKK